MKRIILILLGLACAVLTVVAQSEMIENLTLESGAVYPSAVYKYHIYIPRQYDGSTPAALYVGLDGVLCNAPEVFDSLIASGDMPVTIGVFLEPGIVRNAAGDVVRYNRSNEFDMTDDRFATFLETELLPAVEQVVTRDGRKVKIIEDANLHAIFGASSGGIAAFVAAWHRPDLFRRVFSAVGTYVAMRGGNDLQAMIRKTEPKPLRIYLQDGSNDVWNPLFGHWYEANKLMASAFEFAGYDLECDWSDTGHSISRASRIFADAMRWLWHDWQRPVMPGSTNNDLLKPMLIPGEGWVLCQDHFIGKARTEAVYPDGSHVALRSDDNQNMLWQYLIDKKGNRYAGQRFYWLHSYDNSSVEVNDMQFDSAGNLFVATNWGIQICDQNGRVRGVLTLPARCGKVSAMRIGHGSIMLKTETGVYRRKLNVETPTTIRPKSQGQG